MKKSKPTKRKKQKPNRRNQAKYPALDPKLNLKSRQDLIDYDYLHKLSPEELEWLNKFTNEYANDVLDRDNRKNNLHRTKKMIKDCDDRNNARNRCIYTQQKASGTLNNIEDLKERNINPEAELNLRIDLKNRGYLSKEGEIRRPHKDKK